VTAPTFDGTQACADVDLDLFFLGAGHHAVAAVEQAKEICRSCHFQVQCLEYAIWAQGVPGRWVDGVWGGTTVGQRAHLRRTARRAAA
jgi:WhiB family redox-sensing transcriptional regulator